MKELQVKPEKCLGCRTCELVCSFGHNGAFNPRFANLKIMAFEKAAICVPVTCMQCEDPCCMKVCPVGAISRDENNAVVMNSSKCIGCKLCVKACPKEGALTVENFLAKINYDICIGCGLCSRACPRQLITVDGKVLPPKPKKEEPKKEAPKAAPAAEAPKAAEAAPAAPAAEPAPAAEAPKAE